jgi:hypothetical protein
MGVIWWVTAAVGAIAVNLIATELFAWGPRLSEWLMRRAVRRLAPEMQNRMQEEWAGHLQMIPPGLWRMVAAAGFYLATRQINVALRVQSLAAKKRRVSVAAATSTHIEVLFQKRPLKGASLRGANLTRADLRGARITQTQLDEAYGTDVKLDPGLTIKPCPK